MDTQRSAPQHLTARHRWLARVWRWKSQGTQASQSVQG
jgi:hypothetical protein